MNTNIKRALICGVSGQDGSYLAQLLLKKGYEVWGTSRDAEHSLFANLSFLGIRDSVKTISMTPNDLRSVLQAIKTINPHEIYNLAGQSSVGLSFEQPVETLESIAFATLNFLEAIKFLGKPIRFYNAGSSECFGNLGNQPADEKTVFKPASPYAVAKSTAYWLVESYRESYGLFACTGILFNHESPLRPSRFVTRKIIQSAVKIFLGGNDKLTLGNLSIKRDWGWSEEYVQAIWAMLQMEFPEDFVIATGEVNSLQDFVATAFDFLNLDWQDHVEQDKKMFRPSEIFYSCGNPYQAKLKLNWEAQLKMRDVIIEMIRHEKILFNS